MFEEVAEEEEEEEEEEEVQSGCVKMTPVIDGFSITTSELHVE